MHELDDRLEIISYNNNSSFDLLEEEEDKQGDVIDPVAMREKLNLYGYRAVGQVEEHGEYSTRGSILDLFPMGSSKPFRIDFFDDEVESIRSFDAETQRSIEKVDDINLLPAQEYPLDEAGIRDFRLKFRETFDIDPNTCPLYVDISEGIPSPGIEYYLPLFFDQLVSLFDYLPADSRLLIDDAALPLSRLARLGNTDMQRDGHRRPRRRLARDSPPGCPRRRRLACFLTLWA